MGLGWGRRWYAVGSLVVALALAGAVVPLAPVAQAAAVAAPVVITPTEGQRVYGGGYTARFHVEGTAEPGATVRVYEVGAAQFICTVTANAQGVWLCDPALGHPATDQTFTLRVTAEVGGVMSEPAEVTFIQDWRYEFRASYPNGQAAPDGQTVLRAVITLDPSAPGGEFTVTGASVDPGAVEFLNLPVTSVGHQATVELRVVERGKHAARLTIDGQPLGQLQFYQSDLQVTELVPRNPEGVMVAGRNENAFLSLAGDPGLAMTGLASSLSFQVVNTTNPGQGIFGVGTRDCSITTGCPGGTYWVDFTPRQAGVFQIIPVVAGLGAVPEHTLTVTVLDACVGEGCVTGLLSWSATEVTPGETVTARVVVVGEGGAALAGRTVDFAVDNPSAVVSAPTCVTDAAGACQVAVTLGRDGRFILAASVDGIVIPGSTQEVMVLGTLDRGASTFTIANRGPAPGASTAARVELRDAAGLPISNATVWLVAPGTTTVRFSVQQTCTYQGASACQRLQPARNGEGAVSASLSSTGAGSAVIEAYVEGDGPGAVTIDGTIRAQRIGSPITVTWSDAPAPEPDPEPVITGFTVRADGPVVADGLASWTGQVLVTRDGQPAPGLAVGDIGFLVDPVVSVGPVVDAGDGRYTVTFTATAAGQYEVVAAYQGVAGPAATLSFVEPACAACLTVTVTPSASQVGPGESVHAVVEVRDAQGRAVADEPVALSVDAQWVFPSSVAGSTGADGTYTATFIASQPGQFTITAEVRGAQTTATVEVAQAPEPVLSGALTVSADRVEVEVGYCGAAPVASPQSLTARLVVTDEQSRPVAGLAVDFQADAPLAVPASAVTDDLGVVEVPVAVNLTPSPVTGVSQIRASVAGVPLDTRQVRIEARVLPVPIVDPVLAAQPTAGSPVLADGEQSYTVTVEFRDACGLPVADAAISFAVTGSAQVDALARTDGDGRAVVVVRDATAQTVSLTATWSDAPGSTRAVVGSPAALVFSPVAPPAALPAVSVAETQRGFTFTGTGFAPGERVSASVSGDRSGLGTQRADARGTVVFTWSPPTGLAAGEHQVTLTGAQSGPASAVFTTSPAPPPSPPPGLVGRLLLLVTALWMALRWILAW